jgi:hypothetical protein
VIVAAFFVAVFVAVPYSRELVIVDDRVGKWLLQGGGRAPPPCGALALQATAFTQASRGNSSEKDAEATNGKNVGLSSSMTCTSYSPAILFSLEQSLTSTQADLSMTFSR